MKTEILKTKDYISIKAENLYLAIKLKEELSEEKKDELIKSTLLANGYILNNNNEIEKLKK